MYLYIICTSHLFYKSEAIQSFQKDTPPSSPEKGPCSSLLQTLCRDWDVLKDGTERLISMSQAGGWRTEEAQKKRNEKSPQRGKQATQGNDQLLDPWNISNTNKNQLQKSDPGKHMVTAHITGHFGFPLLCHRDAGFLSNGMNLFTGRDAGVW